MVTKTKKKLRSKLSPRRLGCSPEPSKWSEKGSGAFTLYLLYITVVTYVVCSFCLLLSVFINHYRSACK